MLSQPNSETNERIALLGELHPLLEQLGTTDGLFSLSNASRWLQLGQVQDLPSLTRFLEAYSTQLLVPVELPTIQRAYDHACRNECREIVAMDSALEHEPVLREFAQASKRVGASWIKRLRPLRDERLVQRYLRAVENGEANGWHTIVYGITLALYSLPARQGLLDYGRQTLQGFIRSASASLRLTPQQCRVLLDQLSAPLPEVLERLLRPAAKKRSGSRAKR